MRRISILTILCVVVATVGCSWAVDPPSPTSHSKPVGKTVVETPSSQAGVYEKPSESAPGQEAQPGRYTGDDKPADDGLALKSETPVADAEAERVLKDLEKELDALIQAIKDCENIAAEDLDLTGVEK